jgi:hypothetical protein
MEAVLGEASGSAHQPRRENGKAPQLVIDPDDITLTPSKIVLKHTDDGGYFCLGLGPSAEFLRAVDEDRRFGAAIDDAEAALRKRGASFASNHDPFLRRLGAAVALAKEGFDPNQPRDDHGRWTGDGASGGAAAVAFVSRSVVDVPELVPALRALATRLLGGPVSAAVAFFGTLFIPTNRSLISEGTVPDAPDLGYRFDQGAGVLTLTRTAKDGSRDVLFSGRYDLDGVFRDRDGNIIGRHLGGSVVIDPDAVPGYQSKRTASDQSDAKARTDGATDTDEPKLCPAPKEVNTEGRKEPALRYQEQITHIPRGFQFVLTDPTTGRDVSYDGCDPKTGTMQEAKGPGYEKRMQNQDDWDEWYEGREEIEDQMIRQSRAAGRRMVEWHFAEKPVADFFKRFAEQQHLFNIIVIHTPAE